MEITVSKELIDYYAPLSAVTAGKKIMALSSENFLGMMSIGNDDKLYLFCGDRGANKTAPFTKICVTSRVKTFAAMRLKGTETFVFAYIKEGRVMMCITDRPENISEHSFRMVNLSLIGYEDCVPSSLNITGMDGEGYLLVAMKAKGGHIKRITVSCSDFMASSFPFSANFSQIKEEALGRSIREEVDGVYTLGEYGGVMELLYTPLFNVFGTTPPSPRRLLLPWNGGEVISVCPLRNGIGTHLFVAGGGGIAYYPYSMQYDCAHAEHPEPVMITKNNPYLASVTAMSSFVHNGRMYVYVLSDSGAVYYAFADYEEASDEAGTFSELLLLRQNCLHFHATEGTVFICEQNRLLFGVRDAESGAYRFKEAHFQAETGKFTYFKGVLTKIVTKRPNTEVMLHAANPIDAYVNGKYIRFTSLTAKSDETGMLDIVQYADSITMEPFRVTRKQDQIDVNPSSVYHERLAKLSTVEGLNNAQIKAPNGSVSPLLPKDADMATIRTAAQVVSELLNTPVMQKGIVRLSHEAEGRYGMPFNVWSSEYCHTACLAWMESEEVRIMGRQVENGKSGGLLFFLDDVFNLLYKIGKEIVSFVTNIVNDIVEFVIRIGKKVFKFVLDTEWKVLEAVSKVLSYIGIPLDKLLDFLKYTFDTKALIEEKDYLKQLVKDNIASAHPAIEKAKEKVDETLEKAVESVAEWAEIDIPKEAGREPLQKPEQTTQSMYLFDIIWRRFNVTSFFDTTITVIPSDSLRKNAERFYQVLDTKNVAKEYQNSINGIFQWASEQSRSVRVNDMLSSLKAVAGMIAIPAIRLSRRITDTVFDFFMDLLDFTVEAMDVRFHIPVLSDILNLLGIPDFSLLDLLMLPAALLCRAIGYFRQDQNIRMILSESGSNNKRLPDANTRIAVCTIQAVIFLVETAETIYTAVTSIGKTASEWADNHFMLSNICGIVFTVVDFGLCYGSGVLYSPMSEEDFYSVFVYGILWYFKTAVSAVLNVFGMFAKGRGRAFIKSCTIILNVVYICLAITAFVYECIAIDNARHKECPAGVDAKDFADDKTQLILQASSYLVDEIRSIIDGIMGMIEAWKVNINVSEDSNPDIPTKPSTASQVELIVYSIRAVLSEMYAVLQMTFGITLVTK